MPVLTPDQFEQLQRILTDAFDRRGIAELVRTKLGERLDNLVGPDQPTRGIVFDLLTWIDKRDVHTLEILLQGAIGMKPENGALRAFCEHEIPGALRPIVDGARIPNPTQLPEDLKELSLSNGMEIRHQRNDGMWGFLRDKRNQQVLGWLGGGLVVAVTGLWAFIYFFPALKPAAVQAECGSNAIVGNVTGSTITAGSTANSDCAPKPK